jgi:hypothetical protein
MGSAEPERHVTWHGLLDTTERTSGFSIGAVYEFTLSDHFTVALTPQYSMVTHGDAIMLSRGKDPDRQWYSLGTPGIYAFELPVSIRAGIRMRDLYPYASAGAFIGYTFRDEVSVYMESYSTTPERELPVVHFEPFSRVYVGAQCGAGVRLNIIRSIALWADWSLMKHLVDPVDTALLTWEAPLRGLWRFGVVFSLEGGDQ